MTITIDQFTRFRVDGNLLYEGSDLHGRLVPTSLFAISPKARAILDAKQRQHPNTVGILQLDSTTFAHFDHARFDNGELVTFTLWKLSCDSSH
jgi:hypothetical protein